MLLASVERQTCGGWGGASQPLTADLAMHGHLLCRLHFPQLALRRRLGQLSCMSRPALKLRSWPLTVLYYLLPFGALRPLSRVGWRPVSRVSAQAVGPAFTPPDPPPPTQDTETEETFVRLQVIGVLSPLGQSP